MTFRHYKAPHFAETLHMFMGTVPHGSNLIAEFDAFVIEFNMQAEREWFSGGMQLTAYTTDSNAAMLFKLTFCGAM